MHTHSGVPGGPSAITAADRVLGVCILIAGICIAVAARTTATILPTFALVVLGASYLERTSLGAFRNVDVPTWLVAAFVVLAVVSAAWAPDSEAMLHHLLIFLLLLLIWQLLKTWIDAQPPRRLRHLSYWLVISLAIGLVILAFETWTQQYLRRLIIEYFDVLIPPTLGKHYRIDSEGHLHISRFELNRSVAAANMMLWPALLCAASHWTGRRLMLIIAGLVIGAAIATFASTHETSKIAFVAGVAVFLIASFRPRVAAAALAALWTLLILGIVPASLVAHQLGLSHASWLQYSAQQRIVIWNDVGERVKLAPWLGVGARTAYVLSEEGAKSLKQGPKQSRSIARHAHNVYLQTWFELGFVGAALMLVTGLSVLWAATRLIAPAQPYVLATFAVFMAEIGSSWEIWQRWFFALFVITAIFTLLGVRSLQVGRAP